MTGTKGQTVAVDIAITGSSGLIGTALSTALTKRGHRVRPVVRRAARGADEIAWDPLRGTIDTEAFSTVDAVVNLAGASIGDKRWTADYKETLVKSRTIGTALLARTLADGSRKPAVLLSGSAIGIYGPGDEPVTEESPVGSGFLADLCVEWEAAAQPAVDAGIRTAFLRTGIVLSKQGGALKKQLPLFKIGFGGKIASGRQWQSWISIADEVGAIIHCLEADVSGAVNLTAPNPVTNADFTRTLAKAVRRPAPFPIPGFAPKLLLGGELVENLLLTGQRVLPSKLQQSGYVFEHPSLAEALTAVLAR